MSEKGVRIHLRLLFDSLCILGGGQLTASEHVRSSHGGAVEENACLNQPLGVWRAANRDKKRP